jgi:hypothetical protein
VQCNGRFAKNISHILVVIHCEDPTSALQSFNIFAAVNYTETLAMMQSTVHLCILYSENMLLK